MKIKGRHTGKDVVQFGDTGLNGEVDGLFTKVDNEATEDRGVDL